MRRPDEDTLERLLAIRVMRLEAVAQGIVTGILGGLGVFVATNWLILRGGPVVGPHLRLLRQFFLGYDVTVLGSVVGAAWGFVYGFAAGALVSVLYNRIVRMRGTA